MTVMNSGKYVFAQIFEFVPHNDFLKFVKKYGGDRKTRHFSCWNQFLCMAFGQLLQVDKTAPEDKILLGNDQKCGQDPDIDSHHRICDRHYPEKETQD